jgi:hypothetical protein
MEINKVYKVAILLNGREIVFEEGIEPSTNSIGKSVEISVWKNPMNINVIPNQNGQGQISMHPTCTFGDNNFIEPVSSEKIVTIYKLDSKLNSAYEKVVQQLSAQKSGIQIVPAGSGPPKTRNVSQHPYVKNMKRKR